MGFGNPRGVRLSRANGRTGTRGVALLSASNGTRWPKGEERASLARLMMTREGSVLHQQALTVSGLFTGLTLTALVLILNSPGPFHTAIGPISGPVFFQILVTYVALLGATNSVAMLSFLEIAGGMAAKFSALDKLGTTFFLVSVFGFVGVLPLLLAPFTEIGALLVVGAEVSLVATYFVVRRMPLRGPPPP